MENWGTLAMKAHREEEVASHHNVKEEEMLAKMPVESAPPPHDDGCSMHVQGWRLAL